MRSHNTLGSQYIVKLLETGLLKNIILNRKNGDEWARMFTTLMGSICG